MLRILVRLAPERRRCGTLAVFDDAGTPVYAPFAVAGLASTQAAQAHGNPSRNPLLPYGDTPKGTYRASPLLPGEFPASPELGNVGAILLEPVGGDAALAEANGRFRLLIHGGASGSGGGLRASAGSLRVSDEALAILLALLVNDRPALCGVFEHEDECGEAVEDYDCKLSDPPALVPVRQDGVSRRSLLMRSGLGLAAFVASGVFFTSTVGKGYAQTAYGEEPGQTGNDANRDLGALVDESAGSGSAEQSSMALTHEEIAQLKKDVGDDAKTFGEDQLVKKTSHFLESMAADPEFGENAFTPLAQLGEGAEAEMRISKLAVAGSAVEGVGIALTMYDEAKKGYELGTAINNLIDGKIGVEQFVNEAGTLPAKILVGAIPIRGGTGVPFGDTLVDSAVDAAKRSTAAKLFNDALGKSIDFGFDLYDRWKGYNIGKPGKPAGNP